MAEPIFFDVLPKFGFAAMEAGLAKFKSAASDAGKSIGGSISEGGDAGLKKLQVAFTEASNVATKSAAQVKTATDQIDVAQRKVVTSAGSVEVAIKKLSEAYDTYGAGTSQVIAAENRVVATWAKSDAAAKAHQDTVLAADAAIARSADATAAKVAAAAKVHEASAATSSTALMATGRALNTVGAVSAVAFTAAMYESAKAAGDFQQSQMRLVSSAGETAEGMKTVSDGLLKLAGDVGYSAGELSTGMYTVESAGYRGADGLKVITAAAQGAKAENADLRKVTDGLTTSMTDFGYTPDKAALVMSKLVTAVGESKANFEEFTGSLHSVEPIAAAAKISLDDVYGSLARITQSGTTADQATQNMADAIRHLQGPTNVQAEAMAKFGINVSDVQQKLSQRGLSGTMQYLADTIRNQLDPAGNVSVSVLNQNAQAAQNAADMMTKMSPAAAATAQAFANGTISRKDFTNAIKGSNAEDAAQLQQFGVLENKLNGFSSQYKNGRSLVETYGQALKEVTGTVAGANVALQLSGDHTEEVNKAIKAVAETTTDADGKVKGFNETQQTLNAKMADAKAAFGAATIELGNNFIPALTTVATDLAHVGTYLAEHKELLKAVTVTVGAFGGAWLLVKSALAVGNTFTAIASGIDFVIGRFAAMRTASAETAAVVKTDAAAEATAVRGVGAAALGALAAIVAVGTEGPNIQKWAEDNIPGAKQLDDLPNPGDAGKWVRDHLFGGDVNHGVADRFGSVPKIFGDQDSGPTNPERRGNAATGGDEVAAARAQVAAAEAAYPTGDPNDAATAARPDITDPGALTPDQLAAQAKALKAPAGSKDDPIWISPGSLDGKGKKDEEVYNPFAQFQTGGFTPASLVGFATTFALNQALGNPYGKLLADKKRGDSPENPMYVSQVDVDNAQKKYDDALRQYGPDSKQAQDAADTLRGTKAAVGTSGGYFDPLSGAITANDPSMYRDPTTGRIAKNPDYTGGPGGGQYVNPGKGAEGWRGTVAETVAKYGAAAGIPSSQFGNWTDAIVRQIQTESGGNPGADNPNDSNGRGGKQHVSGLLQYLPSTFANSAQKLTGVTDMMNPTAQIAGALLAGKDASGAPTDIGHGIGWGPSRQPLYQVPPTAPAAVPQAPTPAPSATGDPLGSSPSLGSLRDLFTGGGGLGPVFKQSPAVPAGPAPPPGFTATAKPGLFTNGHRFVNAQGQDVNPATGGAYSLPSQSRGAGAPPPRASGTSLFEPGGALSAPAPRPGFTPAIPGATGGLGPQSRGFVPFPGNRAVPGAGLASAGAAAAQRTPPPTTPTPAPGGGRPASGGTGKGFTSSIGSTVGGLAAAAFPAGGQAAEIGGKLIDRAIGYVGQLAGIGVGGLLETFALNDSPLGDPGKSVFGRIAGGLAGAHHNSENVAGQSQPPLKPPDPQAPPGSPASGNGSGPKPGPGGVGASAGAPLIGTMNVNHSGDPNGQRIATDMDRTLSSKNVGMTR